MPLLSKFKSGARRAGVSAGIESVVDNLQNILNTKRGYGSFLHDLGIRTLTEYASREAIAAAVIEDVRETIERYEPRLKLHEIKLEEGDTPFHLSFTVRCSLIDHRQLLQVSFDTVFGKYDVVKR